MNLLNEAKVQNNLTKEFREETVIDNSNVEPEKSLSSNVLQIDKWIVWVSISGILLLFIILIFYIIRIKERENN